MTRPEFTRKTRMKAAQRAGFPDDFRCECYLVAQRPDNDYEDCGRQPITASDPVEYHHLDEAESGDTPERRSYLKSVENVACVRRSCHRAITGQVTMPKIVKSRRQREAAAGIDRPKQKPRWIVRPPTKQYPRGYLVHRETREVKPR